MSAVRKCRGCGTDVPANAPFGHCPKCLLELGFGAVPEASPSPGTHRAFGDYQLLEQIGRGGMGVIYKARQIRLNRMVALKMLKPGEGTSATLTERFRREAEAAANLHHPNIVPIYEVGEHDNQPFFSMELIEGIALDRCITEEGLRLGREGSIRSRHGQMARIMSKVARAVDYAHRHAVLHRDLKPSNIILDKQSEPHLTDFGVAKVIGHAGSSLTASGAIMGTPSYMAPEQAAGESKRVTTAADIYSLGAILYEMLTGHPPFRADTPLETLKQVVEQDPKHPSTFKNSIDRDLATICMKCLEKEPQRRYASAATLADELDRWVRKEPILARPVGTLGKVARWCRREPKVATLAGGIALCLVAITIVALIAYGNAEHGRQTLAVAQNQLQSVTAQLIQDQLNDLDRFWTNSAESYVLIESEKLATLTARPPRKEGIRITFGTYTHTAPSNMFVRFAPILSFLETNKADVPLRIDFIIYRGGYTNAVEALIDGRIGFMRPGPAAYIKARQRNPDLRVLLNQLHSGKPIIHGLIFTHKDSGIGDLRQLAGKSVASADEESTFGNYVPKAFLYDQGIRMRDLAKWTYVGAHDETVKQVSAGAFQVGTANSNVVARFISEKKAPLQILHHMQSISFPWVVSTKIEERVLQTIKQSLLSIKDRSILRKIDSDLDGFAESNAEDYNAFERVVMKKADAFEQ
jgi:ABC-type phosphate/phosphonate transport system substrate-binding protein